MASTALSTEVRSVPPANAKPIDLFKHELELRRAMLAPMLPSRVPFEKFTAAVCTAIAFNPKLLEADRASLLRAAATAAELGLSLNPSMGECDILPVWNGRLKKNEAQCRPRVKGLMKLARNSGEIKSIAAHVVHENDVFEWELGLEKKLVHKPAKAKRGEMTHVYCVWKTADDEIDFEVMDREQVYKIRSRSSSKTKEGEVVGPWKTDEDEMWRKTVVKRATKYMPLSAEALVKAAKIDNIHEGGGDYELDHGEIVDIDTGQFADAVDITDGGEPEQPKQNRQVDDLESRVTSSRRQRQPEPEPDREPEQPKQQRRAKPKLPAIKPETDAKGRVNWTGYRDDVQEALTDLDADTIAAWRAENEETLGQLDFEQPGIAGELEDWLAEKMGA